MNERPGNINAGKSQCDGAAARSRRAGAAPRGGAQTRLFIGLK